MPIRLDSCLVWVDRRQVERDGGQLQLTAKEAELPGRSDAWTSFDESWQRARSADVRLAAAFMVHAASSTGNDERLTSTIRAFAEELASDPAEPQWAMLDRYAELIVQHETDLLWVTATGHSTPIAQFWDLLPDDEDDEFEIDVEGLGPMDATGE